MFHVEHRAEARIVPRGTFQGWTVGNFTNWLIFTTFIFKPCFVMMGIAVQARQRRSPYHFVLCWFLIEYAHSCRTDAGRFSGSHIFTLLIPGINYLGSAASFFHLAGLRFRREGGQSAGRMAKPQPRTTCYRADSCLDAYVPVNSTRCWEPGTGMAWDQVSCGRSSSARCT